MHANLGANFENESLPNTRVFNRNFIAENVFKNESDPLNPIYFIGEYNIENKKNVEGLKLILHEQQLEEEKKLQEKRVLESNLDQFNIKQADFIKKLLSSSGHNSYNSYNKRNFKDALLSNRQESEQLTEKDKNNLKIQINSTQKEVIAKINFIFSDLQIEIQEISALLQITVLSQVISVLSENPLLSKWVREGIDLHSGNHNSDLCYFCNQPIPISRMIDLQNHFNDQYNNFLTAIQNKINHLIGLKDKLQINFPSKIAFYEHLSNKYEEKCSVILKYIEEYKYYIETLIEHLNKKNNKPFEVIIFEEINSLNVLDNIIDSHNSETSNFEEKRKESRKKLEYSIIAESRDEFNSKEKANAIWL